ncbi:type 2 isopentenyl-diphosphate Delta-isomerase [Paenibacillus sp. UMB4589-SE434]|uniref:type 2 isopentenyl-diphosphate Delta-isomerase n=1 Tax=Paenibacillus sp. UMB4589-SE434 TaxID=3046314 RepID=UPI00254EED7C|nr:type 2 isopentenyl-diphosphate Delta-isomerase [Paenibacillus sp. UMB4589-SE434]MDK8181549.1 type 2 isopentenyl-diphosphate Delta-isomerase [Paenibacillus sp. UMB4589-SE434]
MSKQDLHIVQGNQQESVTAQRKAEHVRICLEEQVNGVGITTGLEQYRFVHQALPEIDFNDINICTEWFGKSMAAPFLISSMTGGSHGTGAINRRLAAAAEARGWAMGVGSVRAAVEDETVAETFRLRDVAPTIPLLANIGAVQLNMGMSVDHCRRAVDIVEADALVLHLNAMQEVFQPEGDVNFSRLLPKIEALCSQLGVPVGVKEVGWGIAADTACLLAEAGVSFIDVAGAGGTSWSQVEKLRSKVGVRRRAADVFADWGIPTADSVIQVRDALPGMALVASGGLNHGVDAAKALALGANFAGYGRSLLASAVETDEAVYEMLEQVELELKIAMFGIGAASLLELRGTTRLAKG